MFTRTSATAFLICILVVASVSLGRQKPDGLRGGAGGGLLYDDNYSLDKAPTRLWSRAFLRYGFTRYLEGEIGGGLGTVVSKYSHTKVMPADIRLILNLSTWEAWNPYLYGGGGAIYYEAQDPSTGVISKKQTTTHGVGGVGAQFRLSGTAAIDVTGGYNLTSSKEFDGVKGDILDGYWSLWVGLSIGSESDLADSDDDGLPNKVERELGTDPKKADSDGDGLTDSEEVKTYKSNPTKFDSDGDGIADGEEVNIAQTDPLKTDTDGDGLTDIEELKAYRADPLKADSDGDGVNDADEIKKYKTDPNKFDTDGDGLSDGEEINSFKTDPVKADTDGDLLTDSDESKRTRTDPLKADSDGDGLNDAEEVNQYKTDPLKQDTDSGTTNDGTEVRRGTNPLEAGDDVPKKETVKLEVAKAMILEGCEFQVGKAVLTKDSEEKLLPTLYALLENPQIEIEILGHTDNTGSRARNIKLSQDRADAVKLWFASKGVAASRITTKGMGPDKPIASNAAADGRKKNRRVEVMRTK